MTHEHKLAYQLAASRNYGELALQRLFYATLLKVHNLHGFARVAAARARQPAARV